MLYPNNFSFDNWLRNGIIHRVTDGDTVVVTVDLGYDIQIVEQSVRLDGINAPETRGDEREDGLRSKDHLIWLLNEHSHQIGGETDEWWAGIQTRQLDEKLRGKYGRFLVTIYGFQLRPRLNLSLNAEMVRSGHAVWKDYD